MMGRSRSYAILRAVTWGGGGGGVVVLPFRLPLGALLNLALAAFMFGRPFVGRLATVGGYHYSLQGSPNVVFQLGELILSSIQFFHGCGQI